jgi:predicted nucleic acid-binding protein
MDEAAGWFVCRVGFVEVVRAVALTAGESAADRARAEWPAFGVVEVDGDLAERAATLAVRHELRSLDALHLAAALVLPAEELVVASWDRRLHTAARTEGIEVLPGSLEG